MNSKAALYLETNTHTHNSISQQSNGIPAMEIRIPHLVMGPYNPTDLVSSNGNFLSLLHSYSLESGNEVF